MKKAKQIIYALLIGIFITACSDKIVEKPFISPPFPKLDQAYTDFTFDAEKGDTLLFSSGSRIIVPPESWVDSSGNKITGNVTVKYREFSDAGDVFLAGIPLSYDTAGTKQTLVTAGMFEIRSFKDSTEIFIANNKSLNVQMASFESDNDYNFYFLNENEKNWNYIGRSEPKVNPKIQEIKDTIASLNPLPSPFDKSYFALNYEAILDIYYKDNYYAIEKNYKSKVPKRKAQQYGLTWSGIFCRQNLWFNGVKYEAYQMVWQNLSGKRLPRIAKECYSNKLVALGDNTYSMTLKKRDKTAYIKVKAIMPIKHLFAFSPDDWKQKYDEVMVKIKQEEKRLAAQFAVYRTFEVNSTGYFNWDRIQKMDGNLMVKSEFKFDKKIESEIEDIDIFYFVENNKSYRKLSYHNLDSIMIAPDSTAKFIAVLSETEAAVFSSSDYNKINFEKLRKSSSPSYTFKMKTKSINSKEDFEKLVSMN